MNGSYHDFVIHCAVLLVAALRAGGPEYVADEVCANCHPAKSKSYQSVGMAQSMRRPRADVLIEDFKNAHFFHKPSNTHYEMEWKNGTLLFRRYQIDEDGKRVNALEQTVDWIVGSGHRSRVYLYRTPRGELFQLPIAWYTQDKSWGMAPGFDRADNDGVTRVVRRECLFCHNAYPDVPAGSDTHWSPQVFPAALPEGTGCQRCHGPGAAHVRVAMSSGDDAQVRAAIVNPAKLAPRLRDAVCAQCHLQPAVAMIGPRRFERGDYSFRPGEPLEDYMLHVDIDEAGRTRDQRFEINHHMYRLQQSACYIKGGITCISCHDPHQPLKSDTRLARVTTVCLGCHQCHDNATDDCVSCHMPRRRTQDVVRVVMTDHRIQRRPPPGDLVAPLAERDAEITDVQFLDHVDRDVYRAVTVLRVMPQTKAAADSLLKRIDTASSPVPRFDLVSALLQQRRYATALDVLRGFKDAVNTDTRLRDWRGVARLGIGEKDDGLEDLRAAAEAAPDIPDFQLNLGAVLHQLHRDAEALAPLTRAIELRPNFAVALRTRAAVLTALGRTEEAAQDLQRLRTLQ